MCAVSYTHLDVYKRQMCVCVCLGRRLRDEGRRKQLSGYGVYDKFRECNTVLTKPQQETEADHWKQIAQSNC